MSSVPQYESVEQRDGDLMSGRKGQIHAVHEQIKKQSREAPLSTRRKKVPFNKADFFGSSAFIVTGLGCFIAAVFLLITRSSSFGLQIHSATSVRNVDCSTIQVADKASEAVITLMTEIIEGSTTGSPGPASRAIEKTFTLDFKTRSILSYLSSTHIQ